VCYAAAKGQRFECPQTACKQPLSDASRCGWPPGDLLFPLAVVAAALALRVPSKPLAERSDWILAALVLFTALGIAPSQLATLGERKLALAALVLVQFGQLCVEPAASWSPDGRRISSVRRLGPLPVAGPPLVEEIFVMDADGSKLRQLTQLEPNSGSEDHMPT
jgi:hypothetical protein